MRHMYVKPENSELITAAIKDAEGRSKERLLTFDKMVDALAEAEERLLLVSTKTDAYGTHVTIDVNAQKFPAAYKHTPMSTAFGAKYTRDGWLLTNVTRVPCSPKSRRILLEYTGATIYKMADRMACME